MNVVPVDDTLNEWDAACATSDLDRWVEHLDRVPVCDFLPVLNEREALLHRSRLLTLSQWLNHMGSRPYADISAEVDSSSTPIHMRLASATYIRWLDRIETLLRTSPLPHLPQSGVVQYFVDHLAASVLIGYKRVGSTVQLHQLLAVPNPEAYLEPLRALRLARNPAQLELLRRSLYSRHKVVVQRNTLIHIDRERAEDVFGPTIDTLFLNDWLHANRYARERTAENAVFFEDPVPRSATEQSQQDGTAFLEVGCGNGLLTASFARNEARIRSFAAIDSSHAAVNATYENVARQRQLHGSAISSRGRFTVGRYSLDAVPHGSDLVVFNPPYIPEPFGRLVSVPHPLATATVGTDLLQEVLRDAPALVASEGELLMISSTLAEPEIFAAVPDAMTITRVVSRSVPFDIDAVRDRDTQEHVDWLRRERGLRSRGQSFVHDIAIYRLTHRAA